MNITMSARRHVVATQLLLLLLLLLQFSPRMTQTQRWRELAQCMEQLQRSSEDESSVIRANQLLQDLQANRPTNWRRLIREDEVRWASAC